MCPELYVECGREWKNRWIPVNYKLLKKNLSKTFVYEADDGAEFFF